MAHFLARRLTTLALMALCAASAAEAQASELRGRVVTDSGVPIANVTVTLAGLGYSVRSDSSGRFRLAGTPGSTLQLMLRAEGFRDDSASVVLARGKAVVRDFVLVSMASAAPEANPSEQTLRGVVLATDGSPIAYANVQLNGGRRFITDDSGRFTLPVAVTGSFSLLFRRIGFEPYEGRFSERPDTTIRVRMTAVARVLPGQVVTGRAPFTRLDLGGFYGRMSEVERGARVGYFVTPEDLELRNPLNVTDAVEQFPSIRLRPIEGGLPHARNMRIEDRNGCPLTVYLDRVRIQPTMVRSQMEDTRINELVQPQGVAGIEVYPRAIGAPAEYQSYGGTCGVVLIWTK